MEKKESKVEKLSFETSMVELEEIVQSMNQEKVPLENLVDYHQRGKSLLIHCEKLLKKAQNQVGLVTLSLDSEVPESTLPQEQALQNSPTDLDDFKLL